MPQYYYDLPPNFNSFFIVPDNLERYTSDRIGHHWGMYPIEHFITQEGISWLRQFSLYIKSYAMVFKCTSDYQGPIHMDGASYAINNVLSGMGVMQWFKGFENSKNKHIAKYTTVTQQNFTFPIFDHDNDLTLDDSWYGKCAVVRTDIPHRVITQHLERMCVSFRFENGSFNQLVSAINTSFGHTNVDIYS